MYEILLVASAELELSKLRAFDRNRIVTEMESQLSFQPAHPTRNRKILVAITPPWPAMPPIWELRIGRFRVFYDIDRKACRVYVRAIRTKPPHKTMEEIL